MTCLEESQPQLPHRPAAEAAPSCKREPQRGRAAAAATITTPVPAAAMRHLQLSGWYWGSLTASDARQMLRQSAEGTFLVRDSTHPDYLFTLSVKTSRGPTNVRIECAGGKFSLDSAFVVRPKVLRFDDVVGLVQFYVGASQLEAADAPGAAETAGAAAGDGGGGSRRAGAAAAVVNSVGAADGSASVAGDAAAAAVNNVGGGAAAAGAFTGGGAAAAAANNTATSAVHDGAHGQDGADRPVLRPQQPTAATTARQPTLPQEAEPDDDGGGHGAVAPPPPPPRQQQPLLPPPPPPLPPPAAPEIVVPQDDGGAAAAVAPARGAAAPAAASVQLKLTRPYYSSAPTLQHLSRTVINRNARAVAELPLPSRLKEYLDEYPYRL